MMENESKEFGVLSSEITLNRIKRKLRPNKYEGISIQELELSLLCPIGKVKMTKPGRTDKCKHLQCFDAIRFMDMNKITGKYNCPICNNYSKAVLLDDLFMTIIKRVPEDCTKVKFDKNGTWSPLSETQALNSKSETRFNKMSKKRPIEITLEDIPDENKSLQDVTLRKEVKTTFQYANKQYLSCQNNNFISSSQSDASIGFHPIILEAYSLHNPAVSSSASNSKPPLIDLEIEESTSIETSTASVEESAHSSLSSFLNSKPPLINLEPTYIKTSTLVDASTPESVPTSLPSDSNLRPSVIELAPNEQSTKTSTLAKAQESGPTYRLDNNSYLEYLKVTELLKKDIPWERSLEIANQTNVRITTDEDTDLEIIEQSSDTLTLRVLNQNLKNDIDPSSPTTIASPNPNSETNIDSDIIFID